MTIKLNGIGQERKELVAAIAEITGEKPKYMGVPSVAYKIGIFIVTKDGNIETEEAEETAIVYLLQELLEKGYPVEEDLMKLSGREESEDSQSMAVVEEIGEVKEPTEPAGIAIQMPLKQFSESQLINLYALVEAKGHLMKKAFATEELPINIIDDRLDFPWFSKDSSPDEVDAYMHFVTALCDMAQKQKRITSKPKVDENEKYAFRCFLLRLGFIGEEYKKDRKILLQNLSGSAAFKHCQSE